MYLDPRTGETFSLETPIWRAPSGNPLLLTQLPGIGRAQIEAGTRSLWRYRAALPMPDCEPVTLGEGCTPLIRRSVSGVPVHLKCEWFAPTGSFKDRGASVMLSMLRAQGISHVREDSSGNGGAAIAAYAAAGGMRATIFAPASASPGKLVQARAYGAKVVAVEGGRQDVARAAMDDGDGSFYAGHAWHPFFLHGTKTIAYELWEDLRFAAPDNIILPCGGGSTVLGCEIGFAELQRAGEIDAVPRLFAAQPENCAPIARRFLAEEGEAIDVPPRPTIAEGTAIADPVRMMEVLGALSGTRGGAVMLSEDEIARATLALARDGVFVEPTCAQAAAAFERLLQSGAITPAQTTVLVMTGTGLKATGTIARLLEGQGAALDPLRASP